MISADGVLRMEQSIQVGAQNPARLQSNMSSELHQKNEYSAQRLTVGGKVLWA